MATEQINLGTGPNTGDGDPIRTGGEKINDLIVQVNRFADVAAMVSSPILNSSRDGQLVEWIGYRDEDDGGGNKGIYRQGTPTLPEDLGGVFYTLNGWVEAVDRVSSKYIPSKFGATEYATAAEVSESLQRMFDSIFDRGILRWSVDFDSIRYNIDDPVNIKTIALSRFVINGNGAEFNASQDQETQDLLRINYDLVDGGVTVPAGDVISQRYSYGSVINDLRFNAGGRQLFVLGAYSLQINSCIHFSPRIRAHDLVFCLHARVTSCQAIAARKEGFVCRNGALQDKIPNLYISLIEDYEHIYCSGAAASNATEYNQCRVQLSANSITAFRESGNQMCQFNNCIREGSNSLFGIYKEARDANQQTFIVKGFWTEGTSEYSIFGTGTGDFGFASGCGQIFVDQPYIQLGNGFYWGADLLNLTNLSFIVGLHEIQGSPTIDPVDEITNIPPASPSTGLRVLVSDGSGGAGTGDFAGNEESLAVWNGSSWDFTSFDFDYWRHCVVDQPSNTKNTTTFLYNQSLGYFVNYDNPFRNIKQDVSYSNGGGSGANLLSETSWKLNYIPYSGITRDGFATLSRVKSIIFIGDNGDVTLSANESQIREFVNGFETRRVTESGTVNIYSQNSFRATLLLRESDGGNIRFNSKIGSGQKWDLEVNEGGFITVIDKQKLSTTENKLFSSIAQSNTETVTFTLTGVTAADYGLSAANPLGDLGTGFSIDAIWISANDEVSVRVRNNNNVVATPNTLDWNIIATRL